MSRRRRKHSTETAAEPPNTVSPQETASLARDLPHPAQRSPNAQTAQERIQVAAYFLAEHRSFIAGHELEDWLAAERAIRASAGS